MTSSAFGSERQIAEGRVEREHSLHIGPMTVEGAAIDEAVALVLARLVAPFKPALALEAFRFLRKSAITST